MDDDAVIKEILSIPYRCHICERLDDIEFDYMSEIQYQILRDDGVKSNFIKKGFCNYHFWKIASLTTPEAVASMGMILMENDSNLSNSCLICEHLKTKEAEFLNEFIRDITVAAFENVDRSERRVCQPHFKSIIEHLDGETAEHFSNTQRLHNEQLLRALKGFIEKRSNWFERSKNEKTSWWRAIEKLVGRKGWCITEKF
jgi:hypothetical protein